MKLLLPYKKLTIGISLLLFIFIVSTNTTFAQQGSSYTQYMDNLTPLNSTYSLLDKAASVNTLFRTQYTGIQGAPNTFIFNANLPLENIGGAAGLIIDNDNFAVEHQTEFNAYFAKSVQLATNNYLAVSLNGGFRNYIADYASVNTNNDPVFANDIRETKASVGFGILYYTDKYYVGVSVPQLTFRDLGEGSLLENNYFRNHYYFSGAYLANISDDGITLKPATLVSYVRGVPLIADISTTVYFKNTFGIGINYRTNNEMAAIVSYNISNFHIGYSYQFGTTSDNLSEFSNATHEITLGYRFGKESGTPKGL